MVKMLLCPICGSTADHLEPTGDSKTIVCPCCGGYRLSRTLLTLLENGTATAPDPDTFKAIVQRKRANSIEYPTITSHDI